MLHIYVHIHISSFHAGQWGRRSNEQSAFSCAKCTAVADYFQTLLGNSLAWNLRKWDTKRVKNGFFILDISRETMEVFFYSWEIREKKRRYSKSCSNCVFFYVNFKWPYLCENFVFFIQITTGIKLEFCCFQIYKGQLCSMM